ncbi:MAG: hypothetical protein FD175_1691 [Beijerinckiaceae bacterium]|nr:MAG: hypothetical protein FD175_1691 [Beijerinckiaceae bacterium]
MNKNRLIFLLATAGLGGCATHPLPENYSGVNTVDIVRKIRCEARSAIAERAIMFLMRDDAPAKTYKIGEALKKGNLSFKNVNYYDLDMKTAEYVKKYDNSAIAYQFTFNIKENNDINVGLDLLKPLTGGSIGLGISSSNNRERSNIRSFTIVEEFKKLLDSMSDNDCFNVSSGVNVMYPITGSVGLSEVINTFIDLNEMKVLVDKENKDKIPEMAETLNFKTVLSISANPKLDLTTAGRKWQTDLAHVEAKATRTDDHTVQIGLSLPPDKSPSAPRGRDGVAKSTKSAKYRAVQAILNQKDDRRNANDIRVKEFLGLPTY